MLAIRALLGAVLFATAFPVAAAIADLDTSFGSGGIARHNMGSNNDFASATFVASSGGTYVLGYQYDIQNGGAVNERIFIVRLTSSGGLDGSFGTGGKLTIPRPNLGDLTPYGIYVDEAQQRIYLAGAHIGVSNGNYSRFGLGRLLMNGQLDSSFGTGGIAFVEAPTTSGTYSYDNIAGTMAFQPDGKIVVLGFRSIIGGPDKVALARFSATGQPDTSFGGASSTNGFLILDFGKTREGGGGLTILPTGEIFVPVTSGDGTTDRRLLLLRLTSAGEPDTTFAPNGYVVDAVSGVFRLVADPRLGNDGTLTLAGSLWKSDGSMVDRNFIVRWLASGARDTSYGTGGLFVETTASRNIGGARHPSGKVVEASYGPGSGSDVYDLWVSRVVGSADLATAGYVEPASSANAGGGGAWSWLALLGLIFAAGARSWRPGS